MADQLSLLPLKFTPPCPNSEKFRVNSGVTGASLYGSEDLTPPNSTGRTSHEGTKPGPLGGEQVSNAEDLIPGRY